MYKIFHFDRHGFITAKAHLDETLIERKGNGRGGIASCTTATG